MNNIINNNYTLYNSNNNSGSSGGGSISSSNNSKYINLIFFCYGTRGDVQPYCIICKELIKRGYNIKIIIDNQLKYVTDSYGLDSYSLELKMPDIKFNSVEKFMQVDDYLKKRIKQDVENPNSLNVYYQESIGMDLIITNHLCLPEAVSISEKLGIPFIPMFLLPLWISNNEPCIYISNKNLTSIVNRITHKLFWKLVSKKEKSRCDKWRKRCLELKELKKNFVVDKLYKDKSVKSILLFDKVLFMKSNKIPKDYGERCKVFGFMIAKEINYNQIPERIVNFLNLNSAYQSYSNSDSIDALVSRPIVFGLGSMSVDDSLVMPQLKYAIKKFGTSQKWIILNNWSNFNENLELLNDTFAGSGNNIIQFNHIDHIWLYKYCSLVVTHGGIGSCASILHSAIPSIITPLSFDQPVWAQRLRKLGISETLDLKSLKNEDDLYNCINLIKLNYYHYKFNCLKIQSKLDNNALDNTINYIESFINNNNINDIMNIL